MKLIDESADSEYFAAKVADTNGVYFVPAFVGLSAPYWDQYARGTILGLTRGANRNRLIRATLESMAYQIKDVMDCMEKDSGIPNKELKVDGGACRNNFLMHFQADLLGVPVYRPKVIESTARGASFSPDWLRVSGVIKVSLSIASGWSENSNRPSTRPSETSYTPGGRRRWNGRKTGKSTNI